MPSDTPSQSTDLVAELRSSSTAWPFELFGRAADEIERCRRLLDAILAADERGQGLPFAEAMEAAHAYLEGIRAR